MLGRGDHAADAAARDADGAARRGGKVVIVGGFDEGETAILLEWHRIQMSKIALIPSASFAFQDLYAEQAEVIELLARGKLQTQKLINHRFPLDRINEAFERQRTRPPPAPRSTA